MMWRSEKLGSALYLLRKQQRAILLAATPLKRCNFRYLCWQWWPIWCIHLPTIWIRVYCNWKKVPAVKLVLLFSKSCHQSSMWTFGWQNCTQFSQLPSMMMASLVCWACSGCSSSLWKTCYCLQNLLEPKSYNLQTSCEEKKGLSTIFQYIEGKWEKKDIIKKKGAIQRLADKGSLNFLLVWFVSNQQMLVDKKITSCHPLKNIPR